MPTVQEVFTENLNHYIEARGATQKEIREAVDVMPSTVTAWVQGVAYPRMPKLKLLAEFFNIEMSDLIEERRSEYYFNEETAKIAQEIYESSELGQVFDACRKATPEQLKQVAKLAKAIIDTQ